MNDRSNTRLSTLLLLLAALAFAPASMPAPAPTELPRFEPDSSVIATGYEFQWSIAFNIENKFPVGIYFDSLICEVKDLDPGETRAGRVTVLDMSYLVRQGSVSAGGDHRFIFMAPATAEHAQLTFRLVLHRMDKSRTTLTTVVEAVPGPVTLDHPSQFLSVSGRRVEYILFPAAPDTAPGLLLVHDHGSNARRMIQMALRLVPQGYTVMLVSMPGYGQSEGPPDFGGPQTVQALAAGLDQLKVTRGVDPKRLAAWGVSRGATAVTLLAQRRDDLRAIVAEAGLYDVWAGYRAATIPGQREAIVSEAGSDSAAWRERSAAVQPGKPAAILILHGEKDVDAPAQQAHGFAESLKARGVDVQTRFFPNRAHPLQPGEVMRVALEFLQRRLGR